MTHPNQNSFSHMPITVRPIIIIMNQMIAIASIRALGDMVVFMFLLPILSNHDLANAAHALFLPLEYPQSD
jgi:hypothetical protein